MDEAMRVRVEPVPLDEEIERGQRKGKPRLEGGPRAMQHFLQMTYPRQHRQDRLHQHSRIPEAAVTELEVGGIPLLGMESGITQDNHLAVEGFNQRMEGGVRGISPGTVPGDHQAQLVKEQTEFPPDNPAMIGFPFTADLLGTASFPHRMEQLDPIAVDHAQDRWDRQKDLRPLPVRRKQTQETRPFRQGGKQAPPIAAHPPIESPGAPALEGKKYSQRDDLTWPEAGQGMFGDSLHGFVYPIEQLTDKILGGHVALLGLQRCRNLELEDTTWLFSRST